MNKYDHGLVGAAVRWTSAACLSVALLSAGGAGAQSPVPTLLPVEGFLTTAAGAPITASTALSFRLYDGPTGGTAIFTETQTLTPDAGHFSAYLGEVTSLSTSTFTDNAELWLGVTVGAGGTELPRVQVATSAYSFTSAEVGGASSIYGVYSGAVGRFGQAASWNPHTLPGATTGDTREGVWVESEAEGESGGFFANGDIAVVWSPGDGTVRVPTFASDTDSVLFAIADEDGLSSTGGNYQFAFSNFGPRAISTYTGAFLSSGGTWTNASDRSLKTDFESVDPESILAEVAALPISRWRYRTEDVSVRHIGPMAQDFHAAFGLGGDDRTIATVDTDGVALLAIQALHARERRLAAENAELRARVASFESRLAAIERRAN